MRLLTSPKDWWLDWSVGSVELRSGPRKIMVKPTTIKIDSDLWKKFKAISKRRGIRLEAALDQLFRQGVDGKRTEKSTVDSK